MTRRSFFFPTSGLASILIAAAAAAAQGVPPAQASVPASAQALRSEPQLAPGSLDASQRQSGPGNNGIVNSLEDCRRQARVCSIVAPALYSQAEEQPWGGANGLRPLVWSTTGPRATDSGGMFLDYRFGAPQFLLNTTGIVNPKSPERFTGTPFSIVQNVMGNGNGLSPHAAPALLLGYRALQGTRDLKDDEGGGMAQETLAFCYTSGTCSDLFGKALNYSTADVIPIFTDGLSAGQRLAQNEGIEWRSRLAESGEVAGGKLLRVDCPVSGPCSMPVEQSQGKPGSFGADTPLIDISHGVSSGYVTAIGRERIGDSPVWGGKITGSSAAGWDAMGLTQAISTVTAPVNSARHHTVNNGPVLDGKSNPFPLADGGVRLSVANSAGFHPGKPACIFDSHDLEWQCARVTEVTPGILTVDELYYPVETGSIVAQGGLTGYAFGLDADVVSPGNLNGYGTTDEGVNQTIRPIFPVIANSAGNQLLVFDPNSPENHGGVINTRAYPHMGSGGRVALTVTGGRLTGCAAEGGSGYWAIAPPQVKLSGDWSQAPSIHLTASGALTGCVVDSPGEGVARAAAEVLPVNGYHLYPQATVVSVYNAPEGRLDGSGITTTPPVGQFAAGDMVEDQHFFRVKISGLNQQTGLWQMGGQHSNFVTLTGGQFGSNDYEAQFGNTSAPTLYNGYGLGTPYIVGRGQLTTPYGIALWGPHRNGLWLKSPPFSHVGVTGALVVGCRSAEECARAGDFNFLNASNTTAGAEDVLHYSFAEQSWTLTAGARTQNGGQAACGFRFSTTGLTIGGGGCATLTDSAGNLSAEGTVTAGPNGLGVGQNLLRDSEFPQGQSGGSGSWHSWCDKAVLSTSTGERQDPLGGHTALKLTAPASGGACGSGLQAGLEQAAPLESGQSYVWSVWAAAPAPAELVIAALGVGGSATVHAAIAADGRWHRVALPFIVRQAQKPAVAVGATTPGATVYLWHGSLEPGSVPGPCVRTGGAPAPARSGLWLNCELQTGNTPAAAASHKLWNPGSWQSSLAASGPLGRWTPLDAIVLDRFEVTLAAAPEGCATTAVLAIVDLTASQTLTSLTAKNGQSYLNSGPNPLNLAVPAGHTLALSTTEAATGCRIAGSYGDVTVQYQ